MGQLIKCSEFVKRQTKDSGFSYYSGSWEDLEKVVHECFRNKNNVRPGYKPGVVLVDLSFTGFEHLGKFYSAMVDITEETKLNISYAPRLRGEDPFIRISAKADKQETKFVTFVLYHKDVLAEDDDRSTDSEWELIAIKARMTKKEEPMDPYTMARNFLHLKGGTKGDFTAQQFAESIVYWNSHCMTTGRQSWFTKLLNFFKGIFR
jgi:hypothetical protein